MGDIMKVVADAEDLLCKGIKEITAKPELDANSLAVLAEAIDTVEDIFKIKMYKDIENGEYDDYKDALLSRDGGYSYASHDMKYPDYLVRDTMMPVRRGNSYNDGRHYNGSNSYRGNSNDNYGRGYVRSSMQEHLRHALKDAESEADREAIRKLLDSDYR